VRDVIRGLVADSVLVDTDRREVLLVDHRDAGRWLRPAATSRWTCRR
jgi:hypothetical protein